MKRMIYWFYNNINFIFFWKYFGVKTLFKSYVQPLHKLEIEWKWYFKESVFSILTIFSKREENRKSRKNDKTCRNRDFHSKLVVLS